MTNTSPALAGFRRARATRAARLCAARASAGKKRKARPAAGRFFGATLPAGTTQGAFAYDQAAGRLVWDANGSAAGGRSVIALLDPGTALAATGVIVIG